MSTAGRKIRGERLVWSGREVDAASYAWEGPLKTLVVLSEWILAADGRAVFSCGAGRSVEEARGKAWFEGLSLLENFEGPDGERPDLDSSRGVRDLMRWHKLNIGRQPFYRGGRAQAVPRVDAQLKAGDFWVAVSALKRGLFFARAYSSETQNLFVGPWRPAHVHPRLRTYLRDGMEPPYAY
jgi:hypothetical protein